MVERAEWQTAIPGWERDAMDGGPAIKNKESLILRQEVEALLGETAWLVLLHEMKTEEGM